MTKATFLFFILLLSYLSAIASNYHRGPKVGPTHKTGLFLEENHLSQPVPPSHTALGPGDSIGFTTYDYGTNGGALDNIILFDDEAVSIGRMAQDETGSDSRGTYFTFTDNGNTWLPWLRAETVRSGWGSIDQMLIAGGTEVIASHTDTRVNVDAARGAGVWTESLTGGTLLWPRSAVGQAFEIHILGGIIGGGELASDHGYTRSTDAGATFDVVDDNRVFTMGLSDADALDIAADGDNVFACVAPAWDGTSGAGGPDVLLATSTNRGNTWTDEIIYDAPDAGELPKGEETFVPDGSSQLLVDNAGKPHVFWGSYLAVGDASNNPSLFLSVDAPIMHWSEETGVTEVAFPNPDTTIGPPVGRDGNYATQPDAGIDDNGNLYVIFQRMINEVDPLGRFYEHVFGVFSSNGGAGWGEPFDVTPGAGFDAAFASMACRVENLEIHFVYNCDDTAGNSVQGNHAINRTAVMYQVAEPGIIIISTPEEKGDIPLVYLLHQNYPNPFNAISNFGFGIPQFAHVSLTIYDLLGQEIATIVNERLSPGSYTRQWDATGQPSGVYFYRLRAGDPSARSGQRFVETRNLLLIR